jgi:hypothetical protein
MTDIYNPYLLRGVGRERVISLTSITDLLATLSLLLFNFAVDPFG